ncbi:MAG: hypothetical protein ACI85I_002773 [Arenicella sp.]|jgi:hypothetical protein
MILEVRFKIVLLDFALSVAQDFQSLRYGKRNDKFDP